VLGCWGAGCWGRGVGCWRQAGGAAALPGGKGFPPAQAQAHDGGSRRGARQARLPPLLRGGGQRTSRAQAAGAAAPRRRAARRPPCSSGAAACLLVVREGQEAGRQLHRAVMPGGGGASPLEQHLERWLVPCPAGRGSRVEALGCRSMAAPAPYMLLGPSGGALGRWMPGMQPSGEPRSCRWRVPRRSRMQNKQQRKCNRMQHDRSVILSRRDASRLLAMAIRQSRYIDLLSWHRETRGLRLRLLAPGPHAIL
jgi:hypothetical protein